MEELASYKGHIVAFPLPLQGHINPMLILCKALVSLGFSVTFVNAESNHKRLLAHISAAPSTGIDFVPIPDHLDTPIATVDVHNSNNLLLVRNTVRKMRADFESVLKNIVSNVKVKFILSEMSVGWTQETADKFGIPKVTLFTESAASLSIQYHIPELLAKKHAPVRQGCPDLQSIDYLPGFPLMTTADIPYSLSAHAEKLDPGFAQRVERKKVLLKAKCVLVNSFDALEHGVFAGLRAKFHQTVVPVGPLLPPAFLGTENGSNKPTTLPGMWPADDTCKQWLDRQQDGTVLYVSFGSNATLTMDDFVRLARGLGLCKQLFLWVVRPTLVPGSSLDELLKVVRRNSIYEGQSCTVSWAPQLQVLLHPAVGWFVTHCGWNSTLESICAGVPMLCWPLTAEQNLNCKFIADEWKIGVRLLDDSRCIEEVITGVVESQGDSQMKTKVKKLKEAAIKESKLITKTIDDALSSKSRS
ncbi:hypothetical protein SELMODRAFT_411023 [Selaginella moellendorffii]|uniref:Glycosyltransferase n=2 Tax=Selaginella moellendorffii TaxID=88036 RepID=D8RHR8_SELML|nr:hypothetical protein SELMODRAFT_411023 [Selaginella moellendorffii]